MMGERTLLFKQSAVRDLAWVMSNPGLMETSINNDCLVSDEWCQQTYSANVDYLHLLDKNPQPLLDYLSGLKSYRLGFYFEALLAFWLEHILQSQPFKKNVPVFQALEKGGRKTLGEFDFLFGQENEPRLQHWEATVKFYLYHKNKKGDVRWFGPAGQDRLDIKLARIFDHQLKLSKTKEARSVVESILGSPVHPMAFIKGYLFYPAGEGQGMLSGKAFTESYPACEISSRHLRGWWLRQGEAPLPKRFASSRWVVLPKLHWLSMAWCAGESDQLLDDGQAVTFCENHFSGSTSAILFAEMQPESGGWFEVQRGFVVSLGWPAISQ